MQNMPSIVSSATFAFQSAEMIGEEVYRGKRGSSPSVWDQTHTVVSSHDKENNTIDNAVLNKIQLLNENLPAGTFAGHQIVAPRNSQIRSSKQHQVSPLYVNIDEVDCDDVMACSEYADEIFLNLRISEKGRRPLTTYMESCQNDINAAMRSILVDWLVEVGQEYKLSSETLFLSVSYIDRFLSLVDVPRSQLQLVGITAMLIASKYEEIYAPLVDDFCYITDNTYNKEAVLSMERAMLAWLEFDLTQPTIKTFLRRAIKAASGEINVNVTFEFLASYLAELTLVDYGLLTYLPSHLAASCTLLALYYLGKPHWSATLTHYTGYTPVELRHCCCAVHSLVLAAGANPQLPAVREKYASPRFASVSQLTVPELLPEDLFINRAF